MTDEINLKEELDKFFSSYQRDFQIYYIKRGDKVEDNYIYISYYCVMGKLKEKLSDEYKEKLYNYIQKRELLDFDVEDENGDCIEVLNSKEVYGLAKIKSTLDEFESNRATKTDFNINDIWGYAIVFNNNNNEKLTLFRKYTIPKSLSETKKIFFSKINNKREDEGEVELIDKEIISLDLKIDSFELGDKVYVLSKYYFHQFFSYKEAYVKFVDDSLKMLGKIDVIDNFDDFCLRCKESFNLTKKMVKVIKEDRLNWLQNNIDSVIKVIDEYDLKVGISEDNKKIIYSNKCKITDFMTLVCGECVRDAVDSEKGIARIVKKIKKKKKK